MITLNKIKPCFIWLFCAVLTLLGIAHAALNIDTKKSTITITAKQMNVPINAQFNKFNATINYDANSPEATQARVDIDMNSIDLGDPEFNKEVLKKEWFNAAQFPKASYISTGIKPAGDGKMTAGKMTATGKLTIKGKTVDVSFPVTIIKEGKSRIFDGALPIRRLAFNIGEGEWADTDMVADEVVIKFHIVT
jgi:polyisoprenoid-binding protein YceI